MSAQSRIRSLAVEVAFNVRHLGGYVTRDGQRTRPDVVRAASLHRLTDCGVDSLVQHGVRTVVDLRSERERDEFPTPDMARHGIRQVFAPVVRGDASPATFADGFVGYGPVYRDFLHAGRDAFRTLVAVIAESDGGVLFHCAAGKDRTGVAAALLLDVAGVSDEDILADYSASEALLAGAFEDAQLTPAQRARTAKLSPDQRARLLSSHPAYMSETLAFVRERWGSARGYLRSVGLDEATIGRARARMLG
jgi:protein-tyrosine phosphatase